MSVVRGDGCTYCNMNDVRYKRIKGHRTYLMSYIVVTWWYAGSCFNQVEEVLVRARRRKQDVLQNI